MRATSEAEDVGILSSRRTNLRSLHLGSANPDGAVPQLCQQFPRRFHAGIHEQAVRGEVAPCFSGALPSESENARTSGGGGVVSITAGAGRAPPSRLLQRISIPK